MKNVIYTGEADIRQWRLKLDPRGSIDLLLQVLHEGVWVTICVMSTTDFYTQNDSIRCAGMEPREC